MKDDIIVEEDEYFTLIIDPFSLPSGIAIGEHDRTTVIIDDDDCELKKHSCKIHARTWIHSVIIVGHCKGTDHADQPNT